MDRSFAEGNKAARDRLSAILRRMSDADWDKSVGHGWTVKASLAHLANWDRRRLGQLEEWERLGAANAHFSQVDADTINDALLPEWLAMPASEVAREVVAAAEAVDHKLESLSPDLLELLLEKQPGVPFRSRHRGSHLDEIEGALAG